MVKEKPYKIKFDMFEVPDGVKIQHNILLRK